MGIKTKIAQGILGEKFGDIHQKNLHLWSYLRYNYM